MSLRNFDLTRIDGLLRIYLLGTTFALYMASIIISIVAKSEDPPVAVVLFDTAFWLVLSGALCLIEGMILLLLNSNAAAKLGTKMDPNERLFIIG
jgi:hypothetical protein